MNLLTAIQAQSKAHPIPADLAKHFAPAVLCLEEWQDYWLELPGVDELWINESQAVKVAGNVFQVRFENHLGLARLQAYAAGRTVGNELNVEVISPKFGRPSEHLHFFQSLLDDLFARAARLPFTLEAPTQRNVHESRHHPSPLFILHFLAQEAPRFQQALSIIQAFPHRLLTHVEDQVPLAQASLVDADVVLDILQNPQGWQKAPLLAISSRLGGYAPQYVRQVLAEETLDTPENRFILHFLKQVLTAASKLSHQTWWPHVPQPRVQRIRETVGVIQQAVTSPLFANVRNLEQMPMQSRVLQHKEGYRDLLELWLRFQQARRPLFAELQAAMEVRDIATLYEMWVFFAISELIGDTLKIRPVIEIGSRNELGIQRQSTAHFGQLGKLIYNQSFRRTNRTFSSYSVGLRPDLCWVSGKGPEMVFDAKFRMRVDWTEALDSGELAPERSPALDDLYKMHTYRDALRVRAALSVYPGTQSIFYDLRDGLIPQWQFEDLFTGQSQGIGALALFPGFLERTDHEYSPTPKAD